MNERAKAGNIIGVIVSGLLGVVALAGAVLFDKKHQYAIFALCAIAAVVFAVKIKTSKNEHK